MIMKENDKTSLKFRLVSAQPVNYTFRLYIRRLYDKLIVTERFFPFAWSSEKVLTSSGCPY